MATRFIDLLNLKTGTQDHVFDDSSLKGKIDFDFMQEGKDYDCKIELYGNFTKQETDHSVRMFPVETDVYVGRLKYLKVLIGQDIYYIPKSDTIGIDLDQPLYYHISRKDLIQVNQVIHADCINN